MMEVDNKTIVSDEEKKETKESQQIKVSVDNTVEQVLEWDDKGKKLIFVMGEKFLQLRSKDVEKLSTINKQRYMIALGQRQLEKDALRDMTKGLKISPNLAQSTEILSVDGLDPRFHHRWKRPDELRAAGRDGYEIADYEGLQTFTGNPYIGKEGDPELVLVRAPIEVHHKHLRNIEELSRRTNESVDTGFTEKGSQEVVRTEVDVEADPRRPIKE